MNEEIVHIRWLGPFSMGAVRATFTDLSQDYGVYQICGWHPSYGRASLLYIGKASAQTFAVRFRQHQKHWDKWGAANGVVNVYIGKQYAASGSDTAMWKDWIRRTELLLIMAHQPAHNSNNLAKHFRDPDLHGLHILNWGERGPLLPEVSGSRYGSRFSYFDMLQPITAYDGGMDNFGSSDAEEESIDEESSDE